MLNEIYVSVDMYMEHTRMHPNVRVRVKDEGDDS